MPKQKNKNPFDIEVGRDTKTGKFMPVEKAKRSKSGKVERYNRKSKKDKRNEIPYIQRRRAK